MMGARDVLAEPTTWSGTGNDGPPTRPLSGRVALVTGAGRGLGATIARTLAEAGAVVVVGEINEELGRRTAEELPGEGLSAEAVGLDVSDEVAAQRSVLDARERHGRLDVLVNNAGTDVTLPVEELSVEEWDRVVGVNLRGAFLMSKFALPVMRSQRSGHIVNIVSTAAKRAWANASAYHASKWGLLGLSHALHVEGRPHGVKVTALVAGGMRTPFLLERFPDIDVATLQDPANVARCVLFVLLQPEETVIPELMVLPMTETSWP
ncbi:MAG: SDR family oxidoreductase [Chloroflexota bacterium]|nr:SDR family oxidoreductase [Chloroflexota bacterium]